MAKLSVADMKRIAEADPEKHSRKELAEKYGVSVARIGEILRGPKGNDHFPKALLESKAKKAAKPRAKRSVEPEAVN
jgi:Mitochondrial ribosomal protein subunit L20